MIIKRQFYLSAAAIAATISVAAPANAQSEAAKNEAAAPPEIIVTAQRREENLQDVPIAATALSGDQLDGKAVQSLEDLQYAAPSLSITDQGLTQSVNMRGIGIASGSPAVANGVATYIDGDFPAADRHLFELLRYCLDRSAARSAGHAGRLQLDRRRDLHQHCRSHHRGCQRLCPSPLRQLQCRGRRRRASTCRSATRWRCALVGHDQLARQLLHGHRYVSTITPTASMSRPAGSACCGTRVVSGRWARSNGSTRTPAAMPIARSTGTAFDNNRTDDIREAHL